MIALLEVLFLFIGFGVFALLIVGTAVHISPPEIKKQDNSFDDNNVLLDDDDNFFSPFNIFYDFNGMSNNSHNDD